MLNALLFDLDGTLAETDSLHFQIWQDFLLDYGLVIDRAFYKAKISGRLNPDIMADLLPQLSVAEQNDFIERKEAAFRNSADALTPLAGVVEILDWAAEQNLNVAVVTNAPRENAQFMLNALHLQHRFLTVVLGDDLPMGKPSPLPYQEALHRLNVTAEETIAFEDSPSGLRSAVAANIFTVGIATTHDPEDLYQLGAGLVVPDFADERLIQLLNQRLIQRSSKVLTA